LHSPPDAFRRLKASGEGEYCLVRLIAVPDPNPTKFLRDLRLSLDLY
jgi:hypothetical protein